MDWKHQEHPLVDQKSLKELPRELRPSTKFSVKYSIMEGILRRSKAQRQPPRELWRKLPHGVDKTPSWVESTQSSPVSHERKEENFSQWNTPHQRFPRRSKSTSKLLSELFYPQQTTHHQRLPHRSKPSRGLLNGSPTHSTSKLFSPVGHTPKTSS